LVQIRIFPVLDVVIESKDQLLGILDLLRADSLKLLHHRRGIVVRHHAVRADGAKVPGAQRPLWPLGQMCLRDFFNHGLTHTSLLPVWDRVSDPVGPSNARLFWIRPAESESRVGSFLRPSRATSFPANYPGLTPWAAFLHRFAVTALVGAASGASFSASSPRLCLMHPFSS